MFNLNKISYIAPVSDGYYGIKVCIDKVSYCIYTTINEGERDRIYTALCSAICASSSTIDFDHDVVQYVIGAN